MVNRIIYYFLTNRIVAALVLAAVLLGGLATAPFNWHGGIVPRAPIAVDAIPDIGDNQQIVATEWMGRSPKDIQEQVTYPLSTALLGIPGVKTIRATSMFGMSFIYIIFSDEVEFYWSRSRILEKLNSLPADLLPEGVQPTLGPDATALGQIFWYTLEGRDPKTGKPNGGWDPQELRTLQDYYVRYGLAAADGVSEVASVGGFVKEYQVDLDPDAMRAHGVNIMQAMLAVKNSNIDVGAGTMEVNKAEYLIRGLGYIKKIEDLENAAITSRNGIPVRVKDVAKVNFGPGNRRGGLDKEGQEAVGGVVVARYGSNPMEVISNVKAKIAELESGMPEKQLRDGSTSKVTVVPFYDRTQLIRETIGTLEEALTHEVLICIIVVLILVVNLRASVVIAAMLPLAVLCTFIVMKLTGIEANIVALSGIAIAIGVMVDVAIVMMENIVKKMEAATPTPPTESATPTPPAAPSSADLVSLIYSGVSEVSSAILTAMATTIVSFVPVFAMQAQEGKMFHPLAFTKTFALMSALLLGFLVLPTLAYWVFSVFKVPVAGRAVPARWPWLSRLSGRARNYLLIGLIVVLAVYLLADLWLPLGPENGIVVNTLFVGGIVAFILTMLWLLVIGYERILRWCLGHRLLFMTVPVATIVCGLLIWRQCGQEFMPTLDEGAFMLMPTSMPHTGVEENIRYCKLLDRRIKSIPEVETVVGKWGRVNSALDPAPIQMYETVINYRPEYMLDENGHRARFKTDSRGRFILAAGGTYDPAEGFRLLPADSLVPSRHGDYYRQWRPEIRTTDDIWEAITEVTRLPGVTGSPKLQPIATRQVMLSTGLKAPMGLKVYGPTLDDIDKAGLQLEKALRQMPEINHASVYYDRASGAPYIEIQLDREKLARYGIQVGDVQSILSTAIGGMSEGTTVEGRERFPIRVRYARELRDAPDMLDHILVPAIDGTQIPLGQVADIQFTRGATMINSENTFLVGYITFDKAGAEAEVSVVEKARQAIDQQVRSGKIQLPKGVSYAFTGTYEQQEHAAKRLQIVIPVALLIILLILYFQFQSVTASLIHFSGVFVAFAGGFILIWLYGQPWFMDFSIAGVNMRALFGMGTINLSVAVWVGFIALFGIATDDGVLMGTYIHQTFLSERPTNKHEIVEAVVKAGKKRVRPAAMTTATTLIALLPVLSSTGKGADVMVPMSIPTFGGMLIQTMTMFVVPVLQCWWREHALKARSKPRSGTPGRGGAGWLSPRTVVCGILALAACLPLRAQDSLQTYIRAALRENPEVMASWHSYEAAVQAVCPAGTLGDPELSVNFYPRPMTQVNGRQVLSVSLMQMFPWFGAMKAARQEKAWQAEAEWQRYRESGIRLAYEVERQWYQLLITREKLATTRRHLTLFKEMGELSRYKYTNTTNGMKGTRMSDQYRLQAEQLKLEEQIESLESLELVQRQQFNLLLHREPSSPLALPDSIALTDMPIVEWAEIERSSPGLQSLRAQSEQFGAQEDKARRMGLPMVGVGVQYMLNRKREDGMAMPDMNGMDMWMGMLKVTLPIYRHKVKAQRRAAELMRQTADENYQRQVDKLRAELLGIGQQAEDVRRKMRLYQQNTDILQQTLELMTREYATGVTTLSDLLQTEREQLDYAFSLAEARAQYNMLVAEFEKLASAHDQERTAQSLPAEQDKRQVINETR